MFIPHLSRVRRLIKVEIQFKISMERRVIGTHFTLGFILEKLKDAGFEGISADEVERFDAEVCSFFKIVVIVF